MYDRYVDPEEEWAGVREREIRSKGKGRNKGKVDKTTHWS